MEHGVVRGFREFPVVKGTFKEVNANDLGEGGELVTDRGVREGGGVGEGDVIGKGAWLKDLGEHKLMVATVGMVEE